MTSYESRMIIEERNPTYDEYKTLREAVGWWPTEDKSTKTALNNALYSVVALNNGAVIGIGRIIGDRGLYYYIQDLIVHPDYQRKGLGTRLMTRLMDYIKQNARSGSFIGLMAAQGLENYYNQFGFKARPADRPGMFFVI